MSETPSISVCIPVPQDVGGAVADDLEYALDSLVVQRFLDYEVVITDDSADDAVEALIRTYDFGGRLRYFRNRAPLGGTRNWDEAVRLARAPLVKMLLPQDRLAYADALGAFVKAMGEAGDAVLGVCATRVEDQEASLCPTPEALARLRRQPERLMRENPIGPISATVFRRAPGLEFDPRLSARAAADFYMRALWLTPRIAVTQDVLVLLGTEEPAADGEHAMLRETLLMFEKTVDRTHADPELAVFFWRLMKRHRVRGVKQLARIAALSPSSLAYFRHLFAHPPREGQRRLADFVPGRLRQMWRPIRHALFGS